MATEGRVAIEGRLAIEGRDRLDGCTSTLIKTVACIISCITQSNTGFSSIVDRLFCVWFCIVA